MRKQQHATVLSDLTVDEVSVCDFGANAEVDPVTGLRIQRSVIALRKRDSSQQFNSGETKMSLEQVLKSATSRDAICAAVEEEAVAIQKRDNISIDTARARAWDSHPEAIEKYEAAPVGRPKRVERKTAEITSAEVLLDSRARARVRKSSCSYAKACSEELMADPKLYAQYERELSAGAVYTVPEPEFADAPVGYLAKRTAEAAQDSVCGNCDSTVDADDQFCRSCGEPIAKPNRKPAA